MEEEPKKSFLFIYLGSILGLIFFIVLAITTILGIIQISLFRFIIIFFIFNLVLLALYTVLSFIIALIFKIIELISSLLK